MGTSDPVELDSSALRVTLIGAGLIGRSWAVVFARAGCHVTVHCRRPAQAAELRAWVRQTCGDLSRRQLDDQGAEAILNRIACESDLERAVAHADYIQENLPEDLGAKRGLFAQLERSARLDATFASSTSSLPASAFASELASRHRCLVAHPVNPPHLVPLVELVPAPWTDPLHTRRARLLMQAVGQVPILVAQEIPGFVLNRLQAALLTEAWRLVEDHVASIDDVDKAVRDGLGRRWALIGPFEKGDLNAPDGIRDYARRYGHMLKGLYESMGPAQQWSEGLVAAAERERRRILPIERHAERTRWRDTRLMDLQALKGDFFNRRDPEAADADARATEQGVL